MAIMDIYNGDFLARAHKKLQGAREKHNRDNLSYLTRLDEPEVIEDDLIMNWLAHNYTVAVGFDEAGDLIMGEIGGTIPKYPFGGRVLAISEPSMRKVDSGISMVQEARKTGKRERIAELEAKIETPLGFRQNITLVDGNRNIANYDFTTSIAEEDLLDIITKNTYFLLGADGVNVLSNKQLPNEQYVFDIPVNKAILERLRRIDNEDLMKKFKLMREIGMEIIPEEFLVGYHVIYSKELARVSPVITRRDVPKAGIITDSEIKHLGLSDTYGQLMGILFEKAF